MKKYIVLEQHYGDKQYWPGDERVLREDDAESLLAMGLIEPVADEADAKKAAAKAAADAKKAEKQAKEAEKAAKEAAEAAQQEGEKAESKQPEAVPSEEKADGVDLLDKAMPDAPQNKAAEHGND